MKDHLLFCPFDGNALVQKPQVDDMEGTILDDKYRLEQKIGEGGMGKVYRATHIHMDHIVAVKVLHQHLSVDRTAMERLRREARAVAQIGHPNAVAVTDFGITRDSGIAYMVMEFLEGVELRDRIKQQKRLDYEEAFLVVYQTCSALQAAHTKGIIHRDLKPDNIWLVKTSEGMDRVKVIDFGIAKHSTSLNTGNLTQQGMIVGTPYYMSPEQCRGEELDPRSDIYSMGVILYEMLTGEVPFRAPTPVGVVLKHAHEMPKPLRALRGEIPAPVEEVVLKALRKERDERPPSAMHLSREFEAALYSAGIELKMMGTRTPQTPFSPTPYPGVTYTDLSDTIITAGGASPARETSPAPQPTPSPSGGLTTPSLGTTLRFLDHAEKPSAFERARNFLDNVTTTQRMMLIIGALVVIVGLIAGIIALTRSGSSVTTAPASTLTPPQGMVYVEGGEFRMGNNGSANDFEKPEHTRTVASFFLDRNEVTVEDYYKFLKVTGRRAPDRWSKDWKDGKFTYDESKLPATNVNWQDAKAYAEWAGKRLPTEVEWEYAARGTDGRLYPWGNDFDPLRANVEADKKTLRPVGRYPQTGAGLFDMSGNASEWTDSDAVSYPGSAASSQAGKAVRGGSFLSRRSEATVTYRAVLTIDHAREDVGFRCAMDIPQK